MPNDSRSGRDLSTSTTPGAALKAIRHNTKTVSMIRYVFAFISFSDSFHSAVERIAQRGLLLKPLDSSLPSTFLCRLRIRSMKGSLTVFFLLMAAVRYRHPASSGAFPFRETLTSGKCCTKHRRICAVERSQCAQESGDGFGMRADHTNVVSISNVFSCVKPCSFVFSASPERQAPRRAKARL